MMAMIQNSFVGGEIAPSLHGRSDLKIYYNSAAKVENFIVAKEGALRKRRGIGTVGEITGFESSPRVFAYRYDRSQSGVIVIGNTDELCVVQLRRRASLGTVTATTTLFPDKLTVALLASVQATQIGDTFFVSCKGVFNKKVTVGWSDGTLSVSDYSQTGKPDAPASLGAAGYTAAGNPHNPTSGRTITYAAYIVKDGVISDRKTRSITWDKEWPAGYYIMVTVGFSGVEDFDYILLAKRVGGSFGEVARWYPEDVDEGKATAEFRDENIAGSTAIYAQTNIMRGMSGPLCVSAFQQRLVFANSVENSRLTVTMDTAARSYTITGVFNGLISVKYGSTDYTSRCTVSGNTITFPSSYKYTIKYWGSSTNGMEFPMTLWFSEIGNLYNFYSDRPAADDDPFSPTVHATGPAFIRWLVTYQRSLIVFTDCGIYSVAGSNAEGFSAATCQITKISETSCSQTIPPIETDSGVIFVGADDKTLYTMAYDIQTDSTMPQNQMQLVEHYVRGSRIVSVALQQFPYQVVWCVLSDGKALSFTYEKQQDVAAWARHSVPDAVLTDVIGLGSVTESVAANDGRTYSDILFRLTKNGREYFATFRDGQFADIINGATSPVVATLTTLRAESQDRTLAGIKKNVKDVIVRLNESGPLKVVPTGSGLSEQILAKDETAFTGEAKAMPRGFVNEDGQMTFTSDTATNCEITGIICRMEVNG